MLLRYHYHDLDLELILRFYSSINHSSSHFPGDSSADKGEELGHGGGDGPGTSGGQTSAVD